MRDAIWKLSVLLDHLSNTFDNWRTAIWDRDPDERYCCDGRECGCYGASIREVYSPPSGVSNE